MTNTRRRAGLASAIIAAAALVVSGCGSSSSPPASTSSSPTAAPSSTNGSTSSAASSAQSSAASSAKSSAAPSAMSSGSPSSVPQPGVDSTAAALLPDDVRTRGTLVVAMDGSQGKPFTFFGPDNKTLEGLTVDLANALGGALGVKLQFENTSFDSLIPGLQASRYDLTVAPMLMTPTRLKNVDMIGWIHGGSAFLVLKSGGPTDLSLDKLCGMTVGAQTGSVEANALNEQNDKCKSAAQQEISIKLFPHATDGVLALTAGRIQAFDTAAAQAGYIAASNSGDVTQSGKPYNSGTSSMALPKDSTVAKALTAALQHLIDTGAYKSILAKYGLTNLAVPSASLNSPV